MGEGVCHQPVLVFASAAAETRQQATTCHDKTAEVDVDLDVDVLPTPRSFRQRKKKLDGPFLDQDARRGMCFCLFLCF